MAEFIANGQEAVEGRWIGERIMGRGFGCTSHCSTTVAAPFPMLEVD